MNSTSTDRPLRNILDSGPTTQNGRFSHSNHLGEEGSMPGFFGIVSNDRAVVDLLVHRWLTIWPHLVLHRSKGGVIGAHGFEGSEALRILAGGTTLAVDGDASVYEALPGEGCCSAGQVGCPEGPGAGKRRLIEAARKVEDGTWRGRLHPLFDQLGKILTVDLTLRQH